MKELEKEKQIKELGDFQDHVVLVMQDIRANNILLFKKNKYVKCYNILLELWEFLQEKIEYLCEDNKCSILNK